MLEKTNITGIILAGGKSFRMRTDKGFITWKGTPFIKHSIDDLKPLVENILFVSDHLQYDNVNYKHIKEIFPEAGPLSGLDSRLVDSTSEINIILS